VRNGNRHRNREAAPATTRAGWWRRAAKSHLAEAHDLAVGLALGVEVGAALPAAERQARERVLENLSPARPVRETRRWTGGSARDGAPRVWSAPVEVALPCATQNELTEADAAVGSALPGRACSNARNFKMERFTEGWKRSPPLYGPIDEECCTRYPRFTRTLPVSSSHGTRKLTTRSGSTSRSRSALSAYSGVSARSGRSESRTSRTACWNSLSCGSRILTISKISSTTHGMAEALSPGVTMQGESSPGCTRNVGVSARCTSAVLRSGVATMRREGDASAVAVLVRGAPERGSNGENADADEAASNSTAVRSMLAMLRGFGLACFARRGVLDRAKRLR
jgi:hypothetical protein